VKVAKLILVVIAACILLSIGGAVVFRTAVLGRFHKADAIVTAQGIDWSGYIPVNGTRQWILARGDDSTAEVILYLHGGPGIPETFIAHKKYQGILEQHFVIVHWEQRGAGKSYRSDPRGTTISRNTCVSDAAEVTRYLMNRFRKQRIFCMGHSWGSIIGMDLIQQYPGMYKGYIGLGQAANTIDQERISLQFCRECLQSSNDSNGLARLAKIGTPPYTNVFGAIGIQREYLYKCKGWAWKNYSYDDLFMDMFSCRYYSLIEAMGFYRGTNNTLKAILNEEFWKIAPEVEDTAVDVPVAFFIGRHDYNTPFEVTERYFDKLKAPYKEKVMFEESGHMVMVEEPQKFQREAVRFFTHCNAMPD